MFVTRKCLIFELNLIINIIYIVNRYDFFKIIKKDLRTQPESTQKIRVARVTNLNNPKF